MEYSREELIQICKDAVVEFHKWLDRDSYLAQVNINSIYMGLCAGVEYSYKVEDNRTIWINFKKPTETQRKKLLNNQLDIDSLEDYREEYGYDTEMFDGYGIDWNGHYLGGYLPTRERLIEADGGDWY